MTSLSRALSKEHKGIKMNLQDIYVEDHKLRQEQVNHYQAQAKQYKETAERNKAETQAKRIKLCDASSTQRLREWFRDVAMTVPYSTKTVYIATLTSEGPLRREIEKALDAAPDRDRVTWAQLKAHLTTAFMSAHEEEKLRDDLESISRQPYETTAHYGRRFSEAADLAYPAANRNIDQQRVMLRCYMKGLNDEKMVLRLVQEKSPNDYIEAIAAVAQFESDAYQVYRTINGMAPPETRTEEPMDISAISGAHATSYSAPSRDPGEDRWDRLERQVTGLSREFTKLMAIQTRGAPAQPTRVRSAARDAPRGPPPRERYPPPRRAMKPTQWTETGQPICLRCDRPGHIKRECPQNRAPRDRAQPRHAPPRHQRQGGY